MAELNSKNKEKKAEALDLLTEEKKPSRRERQREVADSVKTMADHKREALDLSEKPKSSIRKAENPEKKIVPSISKRSDYSQEDPKFVTASTPAVSTINEDSEDESADSSDEKGSVSEDKVITLKPPIVAGELAELLGLKPFEIMKDLIQLEVFVALHQAIEPDIAGQICEARGFLFEREKREKGGGVHKSEDVIEEPKAEVDAPEEVMVYRAPIVTFMGHVDHGKTSLLDFFRKSRIASGEAGGITQHIGAYQVQHAGKLITIVDTPGHAIFSNMRARGADVTDIVVLVIAGDDGVMPQTKEVIKHAQAAKKTIVVAINKCDKEGADPMRVKTQLMEHGLVSSELGGEIEMVEVSALTGKGLDELIELVALQSEVLELKANPKGNARAVVIEAKIQAGKGPTASVIVESGTLQVGDTFICGPFSGKVKGLYDDSGKKLKEATPGTPVEVLGFSELPHVGNELVQMDCEKATKKLSSERSSTQRQERLTPTNRSRMADLMAIVQDGNAKTELTLILKTDVQGSVEAIKGAIDAIESAKVKTTFIHSGVGSISESDIMRASSANAIVLGFNVKVETKAVQAARHEGVEVKLYSVVYELIDQVREAMLGLLEPETRESVIGHALVKQVFKTNKGRAAGCLVKDGKILRSAHARVMRGKQPVFDGKMSTLRRFQDEVQEVKEGIECGLRLGAFNEYEENDIIECYLLEKVPQDL